MTDYKEKYEHLLKVLKEYAERKHCYEMYGNWYDATDQPQSKIFEDGSDYGEITFARTLLGHIGVEYENAMSEEK